MTKYQSKPLNQKGFINWSEAEDRVWHDLASRQQLKIRQRACQAYLDGLEMLNLPLDRAPQIAEINTILSKATGWCLEPVPALISFDKFFALLAQRKFPVATFLRNREEFDYLQEPDFFHEVFGHCAMLTNHDFAEFTHTYGQLGLKATPKQRVYLARLYWFTVEFGLVKENGTTKIYGGGILSSPGETEYSLSSPLPRREAFNLDKVLRTPYRIDIMQPIYYVIDGFRDLYSMSKIDLMAEVEHAMTSELLPPLFEAKEISHVG